jgi:hypothetical protein
MHVAGETFHEREITPALLNVPPEARREPRSRIQPTHATATASSTLSPKRPPERPDPRCGITMG